MPGPLPFLGRGWGHIGLAGAGSRSHGHLDGAVVEGLQGAVVGARAKDVADLVALHNV